jgi:nucleotide-binding universal stress UspA family protein
MKSADPANGIAKFVSEHEVDLLAVKRHHRNFLERLLHKSVTKQVLEDVKVPMLVFNQ